MKLKKRTLDRARRILCTVLAGVSLCSLLTVGASAAELGKISEIGGDSEIPTVATLENDAKLNALAQQLGTPAEKLRYVRIYYAGNTRNCVDIPADRIHKDGTQGILYEAHFANPNQIFILNPVGTCAYQIICLESGKLLEVRDSDRGDCTPIVQRALHNNPNGKWQLLQNRDGSVSFRNVATGSMLNARGARADSNELIQFHEDGTVGGKFYLKDVSEDEVLCSTAGRYVRILYAANPSKCIDVPAEGIWNNGTQLQLWERSYGNQNQIYEMENTGDGWVVKNHQSCKIVEVRNSSHQNGAEVAQWQWHSAPCSRWDLIANFDGTVSFRNRESMKYLNLCGGGTGKNGQKFIQWFDDNSESMQFRVEVMDAQDVLSAVYEREITASDMEWTAEHPMVPTSNTTGWSMRENGTWYYPAVGQKVLVSVEYLSPAITANMLKERAYSQSTLDDIKAVLTGEANEEVVAAILKELGFKEVPGIGAAMGVLQALMDLRDKAERNRFADAVNFDARGQCSGVILYTYKTVEVTPGWSKVGGRWRAVNRIETVTSVEYGTWTGDNFGEVCSLRIGGTTGTWHYTFK